MHREVRRRGQSAKTARAPPAGLHGEVKPREVGRIEPEGGARAAVSEELTPTMSRAAKAGRAFESIRKVRGLLNGASPKKLPRREAKSAPADLYRNP